MRSLAKYNFAKMMNTTSVIASCMIFSCAGANPCFAPMRLAGTWKQYSTNAISQLTSTTFHSGDSLNFRCPYQAMVMKMFDTVSSSAVSIVRPMISAPDRGGQCAQLIREGGDRQPIEVTS